MIRYFAAHPTAANLLMVLFVVLGITALPDIRRETLPDFSIPEVEIRITFPGAAARDVEEAICLPVEEAMDGVNDMEEIRCDAREGAATAVVRMTEGADIDRFVAEVRTETEAIDTLPERAEAPVIRQLGRTDDVISVTVKGPMDATSLKAYAESLKARLQAQDEVSLVHIQGFSDHQIRVHVPALLLRQYGVSLAELADTIARQSVNLPIGTIETREQDILLRFDDERRAVRELEDLVVLASEGGGSIRLGDIATVSDRFERDEDRIVQDGVRAARLDVRKAKEQDIIRVAAAVKRFVAEERRRAAPGVTLVLTRDAASVVSDRLQMLVRNGVQGLALVFVTMWLFFRLRLSFWVVAGLPVSFLGALYLMELFGHSINMITMVALLISIGLLMDDAIVISENVASHLRRGRRALDAAIEGTREVLPGVASSFVTTCAVFGPLAFISGDIGRVLKVLPVVLLLVLAVSLVEAFLILPHHLAHSLRGEGARAPSRFRAAFDRGVERIRDEVAGRLVDGAVRWRYPFLGAVVALFLFSVAMLTSGRIGFQAFPDIEGDVIEARLLLPQGTPLRRTESIVDSVVAALTRVNDSLSPGDGDRERLVRSVSVRYSQNAEASESGPHVATVTADLLGAELRRTPLDDILARWREETGAFPDVLSLNFADPQLGPAGHAIDFRLRGADLEVLEGAAYELVAWLERYEGVESMMSDLRPGKPERRIRLRPDALSLGVDAATVANQLRAAFFGTTAYEVQVGVEALEVDVRLAHADRDGFEDLENFRVTLPDGALVPLRALATVEAGRGYSRIHRIDRRRTVTVRGDVDPRVANAIAIVSDTEHRFLPGLMERYPAVSVSVEGEAAEAGETGASIRNAFLFGILGIFLLLCFQFRSYFEPLVVMCVIPAALIGVVWGHFLMGLDLSMPSVMGAVSLSGIVVNDSILLVAFLKRRVAEGAPVLEAARRASRDRFRAVLLTSLTTIAGLTPLLFETSLQAQILVPLVTSIVFGLLATTLLVLFVVPVLYSILDDLGLSTARSDRGPAPPDTVATA